MINKIISFLMSWVMAFSAFIWSCICVDKSEAFDIPIYAKSEWNGSDIMFNGEYHSIEVPEGSTVGDKAPTFTFSDKLVLTLNISDNEYFNYYGISFNSSSYLRGEIKYETVFGKNTETFFIEASDEQAEFYSFIDGFMDCKKARNVKEIAFTSLSGENAELTVYGIATFNRKQLDDTVYINDEDYKIGVCLEWGGSLSYLECLNKNIEAVRTDSGVIVAQDAQSRYDGKLLTDSVNLINRNDTGRVIQQSYYGTNGESDSYEPGEFMGSTWSYNPVQGGNKYNESSKLVDCKITSDKIYIKCRPLDWAKEADCITPSYMEATYTLINGCVKTDCRFTDFSDYNHRYCSQELPAFYAIEPLGSFRYYGGNAPWTDDSSITRRDDLIFWPDAGYPNFNTTECWSAFTNYEDDGFGIGLYVAGSESVLAGVFNRNGEISKDPSESSPTSYIAVVRNIELTHFKPLQYSFLLCAGKVSEMRSIFYENRGLTDNSALISYND